MDGQAVTVVFSDSLEPDEKVNMDKVAAARSRADRIDGTDAPLACDKGDHSFTAKLTKTPAVAYGTAVYGLLS